MKLTLLMITDYKQWHYLTVTKQSALVRGITFIWKNIWMS